MDIGKIDHTFKTSREINYVNNMSHDMETDAWMRLWNVHTIQLDGDFKLDDLKQLIKIMEWLST